MLHSFLLPQCFIELALSRALYSKKRYLRLRSRFRLTMTPPPPFFVFEIDVDVDITRQS